MDDEEYLANLNQIIKDLEKRRGYLRLQMAKFGVSVDPVKKIEVDDLAHEILLLREEKDYLKEKIRFKQQLKLLKDEQRGELLCSYSEELLLFKIPRIQATGADYDKPLVDQMYRDTRDYLEAALDCAFQKHRVCLRLAQLYDIFEENAFAAFKYCSESVSVNNNYLEARKFRIQVGITLKERDDALREEVERIIDEDRQRLIELGQLTEGAM